MVELNDFDGRHWILDLQLNRDLIPKSYFEKYQLNGEYVVNKPTAQEVDMCHYKGKVRGMAESWAAISTCQGLSGVIFDGDELHYLEPRNSSTADHSTPHYLYNHDHLQTNFTCGFPDTPEEFHIKKHHIHGSQEAHRIHRYKRASEGNEGVIRGPYNSNKMSRYVELVLVVDTREYKELGSLPEVYLHCKKITNIINALYMPLNIFVALVGVVVWTELDDIVLSPNGDTTLANFLHYRRGRLAKEHPNDNAQLLTRMQFDGGVVGKALKGPICTYEFSGGVSVDHSSVVGLVATTVAHEMGHNFGMEHDTSDCSCPSERCIMAPSSNSKHPTHWSTCSLEYLAHAFEHGMDYCLRNKPERLFESPDCGNGFVEPGEQCDCGLPEFCNNPCCNASTCMLFANASCATGECCDLQTCKPRKAGHMCRSADHECDLPEFCTGESEFCKDNVFKMDGEKCDKGKAFCYQGSCRTHSDQCRLLWGPSGASSDAQCYHMNTKGSQHGNCGYNRLNHSYVKCVNENILCGMLHCRHLNERLEYGMESVSILSQTFLNTGGNIIPCRTAIVDLGLNEVDPGLAPDGARCGEGKMCVNQKCLAVDSLQKSACPNNCYGRGACNSKGHCHCDVGYAPPFCKDIGYGGSDDSGPASDPLADVSTAKILIFLFALLFMTMILLLAVFYTRYWRFKKSSPSASASPPSQYVTRCRLWLWLHAPRLGQLCGLKYPPDNQKSMAPMINPQITDSMKHRPVFINPNDQPRHPILIHPSVKKLQRDPLVAIHNPHRQTIKEQQNLLKSDDPGEKKKDRKPKFVHRVEEWFSKGAFKEVTRSVDVTSEADAGHTTEITMDFKPVKEGGRSVKSFGQASSRLITEVVAVSPVSSPEMHRKIHTPPAQHRSLRLNLPSTSSTVSTSVPSTPGSPPMFSPTHINNSSLRARSQSPSRKPPPPPLPSHPPGSLKSPVPPRRAHNKLPTSPLSQKKANAPSKPPPPPPNQGMKPNLKPTVPHWKK